MIKEKKKPEKKASDKPIATVRKKDLEKKIELGTGRRIGYISDTPLDEDLE